MKTLSLIAAFIFIGAQSAHATSITFEKLRDDFAQANIPVEEDFTPNAVLLLTCSEHVVDGRSYWGYNYNGRSFDAQYTLRRTANRIFEFIQYYPREELGLTDSQWKKWQDNRNPPNSYILTPSGLMGTVVISQEYPDAGYIMMTLRTTEEGFILERAYQYSEEYKDAAVLYEIMPPSHANPAYRVYNYMSCEESQI